MKKLTICIMIILTLALAACARQSELIGTTWQWEAFQDTAEVNDLTVPDPEIYTLTLNEDGTASIKADCNQVTWAYELDGSQLTFDTTGPSTLAMCPDGSLDTQYLEQLGATASYVMEDGKLYLNLWADAGNLVFGSQ